jgi:hypothetical protein
MERWAYIRWQQLTPFLEDMEQAAARLKQWMPRAAWEIRVAAGTYSRYRGALSSACGSRVSSATVADVKPPPNLVTW